MNFDIWALGISIETFTYLFENLPSWDRNKFRRVSRAGYAENTNVYIGFVGIYLISGALRAPIMQKH